MGMTEKQLYLVRCIADNKLNEAKHAALMCCIEDNTQKNKYSVERYKKLLTNSSEELELPYEVKGLATLIDMSNFNEKRYYLSLREKELFEKIKLMNDASIKLMEKGVPYLNSTLLWGESGTGKTTFAKYVSYKMGLPLIYMNFTNLINSALGSTSKNLHKVFDFIKLNRCVLMLDEIDVIGKKRSGSDSSGAEHELNSVTIALMQELDSLTNEHIVIAATNRPDILDDALRRRFVTKSNIIRLSESERYKLAANYIKEAGFEYDEENLREYVNDDNVQAVMLNHIVQKMAEALINDEVKIVL